MAVDIVATQVKFALEKYAKTIDDQDDQESRFTGMTCAEAETLAALLRAGNHDSAARAVIKMHSKGDEMGDMHYEQVLQVIAEVKVAGLSETYDLGADIQEVLEDRFGGDKAKVLSVDNPEEVTW